MNITLPCPCPVATECETIRDFSFSISDSIENISELQWNKLVPELNVLMHYENLKLIERLHIETMGFRYVLVKKENITIGIMYFQVVTFHASQLMNYFPATGNNFVLKGIKAFSEKLLSLVNLKLLVSGNVFMTGENGFYFSNEIDKPERAKILRKAAHDIMKQDSNLKAVLISDLYYPKTEFDTHFKTQRYHQLYVESDMSIQLKSEWKTFDDYLNALSSKYRVRAKKVFTQCAEYGVIRKELGIDEIAVYQNKLFELYDKVIANADFTLSELSKDFFLEQKKLLPDNYQIYAYFNREEMLGFISSFQFGKKMEVHYAGMNYEVTKPIHLYQHMMYDMIELGIKNRAERLHFGRTAPEIKSTIGATPSGMYGYIKHRNPLFNFFFVRPYTSNLKPREYAYRNPFKN